MPRRPSKTKRCFTQNSRGSGGRNNGRGFGGRSRGEFCEKKGQSSQQNYLGRGRGRGRIARQII